MERPLIIPGYSLFESAVAQSKVKSSRRNERKETRRRQIPIEIQYTDAFECVSVALVLSFLSGVCATPKTPLIFVFAERHGGTETSKRNGDICKGLRRMRKEGSIQPKERKRRCAIRTIQFEPCLQGAEKSGGAHKRAGADEKTRQLIFKSTLHPFHCLLSAGNF